MTTPAAVIIHRLAAKEYRAIRAWYRSKSVTTADRVKREIFATIERIADNPSCGAVWQSTPSRFCAVSRYPYVIYYDVLDPSLVQVLAISHERRRPGYWVRRRMRS